MSRCDLHVHSVHSTDSGNYALRRARLGESYTEPERVYRVCKARGMTHVTISDHNTVEGALRIADRPDTFLSVEVTTRFPEDEVPLHVLVWNLSEADHRELQPFRDRMYGGDFVFNVSREFVRSCKTPMLILCGNDDYHPKETSKEIAALAPNAELIEHWKASDVIGATVKRVREFLMSHTPKS